MASLRMAAQRLLDKYDLDVPEDFLREMFEAFVNGLMAAEATERIGAEPHERTKTRTTWLNGTRDAAMWGPSSSDHPGCSTPLLTGRQDPGKNIH